MKVKTGADQVRVLIADDHTIFREGVRVLLGVYDQIEVVGEASDGCECVKKALESKPDVVLMDVFMPGMDGLEATRRILKKLPKTKVLFLTQCESKDYVLSAIKAGGHGYLAKKEASSELLKAITSVTRGQYYLCPSAASIVVDGYSKKPVTDSYDLLTAREREVLKLIVEGHTSRRISQMLGISLKTVFGHRLKVMHKLHIHNQTELLKYAMQKGILLP